VAFSWCQHAVLGPNANTNIYAPHKCQSTSMVCLCHIIASLMDHNHPTWLCYVTAQCDFTMSPSNTSSLPHHIITCPMYYNYPTPVCCITAQCNSPCHSQGKWSQAGVGVMGVDTVAWCGCRAAFHPHTTLFPGQFPSCWLLWNIKLIIKYYTCK